MLFSGIVVALGCVLEVWETYTSLIVWWHGRKGLEYNENPKSWRIPLSALGLLLVITGVVGEATFEAKVSNADAAIRAHESQVLSVAETNAAIANEKAADAEGRTGTLEKEAEKIREHNDETERKLTASNKAIEGEKEKRLKLAASLMPREVFDQSAIIAELRRLPPHRIVFVYPDESEPRQLAEQIAMVFSMLHWPFFGRQISSDDLPTGVSVCAGHKLPPPESHPTDREIDVANEELMGTEDIIGPIVKAFSARGVKASRKFVGYMIKEPPTTLVIGVGEKSNAEAQEALRELGTPNPTPLRIGTSSVLMESGDRMRIPPEAPAPTTRPPDAKTGKP